MTLLQFVCIFCAFGFVLVSAAIPTTGVIFPDHRRSKSHKGSCSSNCNNAIPISLAKQLSNVDSSEQFLRQFVQDGLEKVPIDGPTFNGINLKIPIAQSAGTSNKVPPANCKPELRTISLKDTNDPTIIYYPMCVRLEQCGGCCNHELLMCQPHKTSQVNVTIIMTQYVGNKTLKYIGKKTVTLLKHEMCHCDCKTKPTDCKGRQVYKKDECRCTCENEEEEMQCAEQSDKLWDPSTCQCTCRELQECSSGHLFDTDRCECVKVQQWRTYDRIYFRGKL